MNEGTRELSREEIRQLAGQVLAAIGVEKVELDEAERAVIEKVADEWRRRRAREKDEGI